MSVITASVKMSVGSRGRAVHPESASWVRTRAEIPDGRPGGDGQHTGRRAPAHRRFGFLLPLLPDKGFHPSELNYCFGDMVNNICKRSEGRVRWSVLQLKVNELAAYLSEVIWKEPMRKHSCPLLFKVKDNSNVNKTGGLRHTTKI